MKQIKKIILGFGFERKDWIIVLVIAGVGLCLFILLSAMNPGSDTETSLRRQNQNGSDYTQTMEASRGGSTSEVDIQVKKQIYTDEEVEALLNEAQDKLWDRIMVGSDRLDRIQHDLELFTTYPDTQIRVEWSCSQPDIVNYEGNLGETIPDEGVQVTLAAHLTLQDQTRDIQQVLTIYPKHVSSEEALQREVQQQVDTADETDARVSLPQEIDGEPVTWSRPVDHTPSILLALSLLASGLYLASRKQIASKHESERQAQLELDYPSLVGKIVLLLGAGLSMQSIFEKIAADYRKRSRRHREKREAYEQVIKTCQEMEGGVALVDAYTHFGERCANPYYRALSTMLVQNLRRGNRELLDLLERDAAEAFEERKKRARIQGEVAGTKLLFPMILMMMIVMVMIVVPAYLGIM